MRVRKSKCPCGLGEYKARWFDDEEGKTDEQWIMLCPKCKKKYSWYSYRSPSKKYSDNLWIPNKLFNKFKKNEQLFRFIEEDTIPKARKKYLEKWLRHFSKVKTKKEIWSIITDGGKSCLALSTFHYLMKHYGQEGFLKKYFTWWRVPSILKILQITDSDLMTEIRKLKKLDKKLRTIKENMLEVGCK